MATEQITRKSYLNGEVTHAEYYRKVAQLAGISYANADPEFMATVKLCLDTGDEHLNRIKLYVWDSRGVAFNLTAVTAAFRQLGDYTTMAGLVCLHKQAARDAAEAM